MPIEDYAAAAQKIAAFLETLTTTGGLRLKYRITAGGGAADPDGLENREIYVELAGPDAALLTDRGENCCAPWSTWRQRSSGLSRRSTIKFHSTLKTSRLFEPVSFELPRRQRLSAFVAVVSPSVLLP